MTLRTKTLTAVAALTISATSLALAQEAATPVPPTEEQAAPAGPSVAPFAEPAQIEGAPEAPAEADANADAPAETEAAPEAPAEADAAAAPAEAEPEAQAAPGAPALEEPVPAEEEAAPAEPSQADAVEEAPANAVSPDADPAPAGTAPAEPAEIEPATETPATEAPAAAAPAATGETGAEEAPTEAPQDMAPAHNEAQEPAQEAGNLPQSPADQEADLGDGGVDAVGLPEGNETSVPVPTTTGTEPVEEHLTGPLGAEAAEEHAEEAAGEHGEEGAEAHAAEGDHGFGHIEDYAFSFEGPMGSFDQFQLQRGLQVYTEVCSSCHGMKFVPIRTLADADGPGLPEDQVRAYATNLLPIFDPEVGEERARLATDHFPDMSGPGMGPDLSLMAKGRAGFHGPYGTGLSQLVNGMGGPEYIRALLIGYTGEEREQAGTVLYANTAFPGGWISMPPPLSDDRVTYEDGTPATVEQMATDVSAFLMWTAEPKLMDRKSVGLVSVLFLLVLAALLYLVNKRLWAPHKTKRKH